MKLKNKILTFVEYCLPEIKYQFSYKNMLLAFKDIFKDHYSIKTLRKEFSHLKRKGFITKRRRYKKLIPTLTRAGKLQILPTLPYKRYDQWDSKWRIVLLNLPKKERKYRIILEKKLEDLGFQKIQKGAYISPHSLLYTINRISTELGIRQYLTLIEAEKIDREKIAIEKIWNLEKINEEYGDFIKEAKKSKRKKFWPLLAKQLEEKFSQIYKKDPHLPEELLPKDWLGEEAYKIYKKIINSY